MKMFRKILGIALTLLLMSSLAWGDGIFRIPGQHGDDRLMPLKTVDVSVDVQEQVAITTVRNTFDMLEGGLSGFYHYRLPEKASVIGFGIWEDGEFIDFNLRHGEQGGPGQGAGDSPDLSEFLGANPFSIPLDSIPEGRFSIEIRYAELLSYDFGVIQMKYPLWCGNFISGEIDTINIDVNINSLRSITNVETGNLNDYCEIECINGFEYHSCFHAEGYIPDEDWELNIEFCQEDIGAWLYTHRSDLEQPGYFMLVIDPGVVNADEQVQKYFTFVIDQSGSMRGDKMEQAQDAVLACMDHLIDRDYFNVIGFASIITTFRDELVIASDQNRNLATQFVDEMVANGGTDIYDALSLAVEQDMGDGTANQIIFATDGRPTVGPVQDEDEIISLITEENVNNARIFSFGIGEDCHTDFITELSQQNHGQAFMIDPQEASIEQIISDFYQYVASPALVNPIIEYDNDLATDDLYPPELQDVAAGKQLQIFGRYETFGTFDISLSGQMPGGDTSLVFSDLEFGEEEVGNEFVPRLWAIAKINHLLELIKIFGERQDLVDQIIALSLEYGILTPYTEYEPPPNAVDNPQVSLVSANQTTQGVMIAWSFTGTTEQAMFNVYRAYTRDGSYTKLNDAPLYSTTYCDSGIRDGETAFYKIEAIVDGEVFWSDMIVVGTLPSELTLGEPHPNPFNNQTVIGYQLPQQGEVSVVLYDLNGQVVRRLHDGWQSAGSYKIAVDGQGLATGNYFIQVKTSAGVATRPVTLLK